jgi:hypothetical protein
MENPLKFYRRRLGVGNSRAVKIKDEVERPLMNISICIHCVFAQLIVLFATPIC